MGDPGLGSNQDWLGRIVGHARTGEILKLAPTDAAGFHGPAHARLLPADALRDALIALSREPGRCDPRGLRIEGADIQGRLNLDHLDLPFPLWFTRCQFQAGASLQGAKLPELRLRECEMTTENPIEAPLNLQLTKVTGQLDMRDAKLANQDGTLKQQSIALNLDGASIGGGAYLDGGFTATGQIRAARATITGPLVMRGATLSNEGKDALMLYGANIGGGTFFSEGFTATGEIHALRATFTGELDMRGATLTNNGKDTLRLDGASIAGSAFLSGGFTATGQIRASGATISELDMTGATLNNVDGPALNLQGAEVGRLCLCDVRPVRGVVYLNACRIADLVLDVEGEALPGGPLIADGWQVRALAGAIASRGDLAQKWLDTRPPIIPYSPQPARALAEVYDRTGHPDQARRLRYTAARQLTHQAPWWAKPPLWAYWLVVGHGYYPLLTVPWLIAVLGLTFALTATQPAAFTPTDAGKASEAVAKAASGNIPDGLPTPSSAQPVTGATSCAILGTYPCFSPGSTALQTVVPPAASIQTATWQPTGWVALAMTAAKAAGWLLTVLLLAGITGLLRRT